MGVFGLGLNPMGETMLFAIIVGLVLTGIEYVRRRFILWKRSQAG